MVHRYLDMVHRYLDMVHRLGTAIPQLTMACNNVMSLMYDR